MHSSPTSALSLLVPRVCLTEHKQTSPSTHVEAVFATSFQRTLGLHPSAGLQAGEVLALAEEGAPVLGEGCRSGGLEARGSAGHQEVRGG